MAEGSKIQRSLLLGAMLSLSVSVGFILCLGLPGAADFNFAVATSIPVACLIMCFMFLRPSITDATFIFMLWAFVFQVMEPWLLVSGVAQVIGSEFFLNNYRLLSLGNLYFSAGLAAYGLGMLFCPRSRAHRRSRLLNTTAEANEVVLVLLTVAGLCWLGMWIRAGAPKDALLLIRPSATTSNQSSISNGYGYFLELSVGTNIALLIYSAFHPHKSLFSPEVLAIIACVLLFNGGRGSRILFFLAPVSVMLLKQVLSTRRAVNTHFTRRRRHQVFAVAATAVLCLIVAVPYTEYREGRGAQAALRKFGWVGMVEADAADLFYESITYYMVLQRVPKTYPYWFGKSYTAPFVLAIPRLIFPDKVSHLWNDQRFVEEFWGYDEWTSGATFKGGNLLAYQYLNFGLMGIIGEMFILGVLNEYLARKARSPLAGNFFTVVYVYYISYSLLYLWKSGLAESVNYAKIVLIEAAVFAWLAASVRSRVITRVGGWVPPGVGRRREVATSGWRPRTGISDYKPKH